MMLRWLMLGCLLVASSATQAQVLVYNGTLKMSEISDGNTARASVSFVMVVDLSPGREPANSIAVLVPHRDDRSLECFSFQGTSPLLFVRDLAGKLRVALIHDGFFTLGPVDEYPDFFTLEGPVRTISLGKGLATVSFATTLSGPHCEIWGTGAVVGIVQGQITARLSTKETKIANQPDAAGGTPGMDGTLIRLKEDLARKHKIPLDRICDPE